MANLYRCAGGEKLEYSPVSLDFTWKMTATGTQTKYTKTLNKKYKSVTIQYTRRDCSVNFYIDDVKYTNPYNTTIQLNNNSFISIVMQGNNTDTATGTLIIS